MTTTTRSTTAHDTLSRALWTVQRPNTALWLLDGQLFASVSGDCEAPLVEAGWTLAFAPPDDTPGVRWYAANPAAPNFPKLWNALCGVTARCLPVFEEAR